MSSLEESKYMCEFFDQQKAAYVAAGKNPKDFVCPYKGRCTRLEIRVLGFTYSIGACLQKQDAVAASKTKGES